MKTESEMMEREGRSKSMNDGDGLLALAEGVVCRRLGVPVARVREWRGDGRLELGGHWFLEGRRVMLTEAGVKAVAGLAGLPGPVSLEETAGLEALEEEEELPGVNVVTVTVSRRQGLNPRVLRCLLEGREGIGPLVTVRLITPRLRTAMFRPGSVIEVRETETPDIFEYHGGKPRNLRI